MSFAREHYTKEVKKKIRKQINRLSESDAVLWVFFTEEIARKKVGDERYDAILAELKAKKGRVF